MSDCKVSKEYSKILRKYLTAFGLEPIDIASLIGTKTDVINGLLNKERGAVLKTLEKISQVFNLRYYEFGNLHHPIPEFASLPEKTKSRIQYRRLSGPHNLETYTSNNLNEKILIELSFFKVGEEFLIEEIVKKIKEKHGIAVDNSLIADRLGKSFEGFVEKTGKVDQSKTGVGRKPSFFKLIKSVSR